MTDAARDILLSDPKTLWQEHLSSAQEAIYLFAPQIGGEMLELLGQARIDPCLISLTTSLKPTGDARQYMGHLHSVRLFIEQGINVRDDPALACSALICDDSVLITSHSLTTLPQSAKCVTFRASDGGALRDELETWFYVAIPVTAEHVDCLLNELSDCAETAATASNTLTTSFDSLADELFALRQPPWDCLDFGELTPANPTDAAAGLDNVLQTGTVTAKRVWARLAPAGEGGAYLSLGANPDSDLTRWQLRDGERSRDVHLDRLYQYPLIHNPSGKMGFARVGRTRITYIHHSVAWSSPFDVGACFCDMVVRFPESEVERSNVHIELRPLLRSKPGVCLRLLFDGQRASLIEAMPLTPGVSTRRGGDGCSSDLLGRTWDQTTLDRLIARALQPFKYKTLGRDNHTAQEFFPHGWHEVALFDYRGTSVLIATHRC